MSLPTPTLQSLQTQIGMLQLTLTSTQAEVATFQADIQTATLTMESAYNALSQQVATLTTLVNQLIATQTSS